MEKAMKRYMPIFVPPTFCAFTLGFIVPLIMGIWLSCCEFTTVRDAKFVGFSNYRKGFQDMLDEITEYKIQSVIHNILK